MDKWTWMALKAYFPTLYLALGSLAMGVMVANIPDAPPFQSIVAAMQLVPALGFGLAILFAIAASFRLWQWERGAGLRCPTCDGLLGGEREGRPGRGGAYRQCLACGKNANHKFY